MDDISIPEFIALVAEQLKEANQKANDRIRKTKDDPFLGLRDVQLQLAFTAEKSKTTEGHIELKPWVVAAGGTKSSSERDAIVHTITINLTLMVVEPSPDEPSAKRARAPPARSAVRRSACLRSRRQRGGSPGSTARNTIPREKPTRKARCGSGSRFENSILNSILRRENELLEVDVMSNTLEAPSGTHIWLVLMKAHRSLMCHAERSQETAGIGLSDFVVLEMLLHKGPQKVSDIGRAIALTSGAITAAVDRVEKRGLVVRTSDPNDRRARVVRLTPKGETLIRDLFDDHVAAMERATSGLTASERSTLVALLKKLGLSAQQLLVAQEERE